MTTDNREDGMGHVANGPVRGFGKYTTLEVAAGTAVPPLIRMLMESETVANGMQHLRDQLEAGATVATREVYEAMVQEIRDKSGPILVDALLRTILQLEDQLVALRRLRAEDWERYRAGNLKTRAEEPGEPREYISRRTAKDRPAKGRKAIPMTQVVETYLKAKGLDLGDEQKLALTRDIVSDFYAWLREG